MPPKPKSWVVKERFCELLKKNVAAFDNEIFSVGIVNSTAVDSIYTELLEQCKEKKVSFPTANSHRVSKQGLPDTCNAKQDNPEIVKLFTDFISKNKDWILKLVQAEIDSDKDKSNKISAKMTAAPNDSDDESKKNNNDESKENNKDNDDNEYESEDGEGVVSESDLTDDVVKEYVIKEELKKEQDLLKTNAKKRKKKSDVIEVDSPIHANKMKKIESVALQVKENLLNKKKSKDEDDAFLLDNTKDNSLPKIEIRAITSKMTKGVKTDKELQDPQMTESNLVLNEINSLLDQHVPHYENMLKRLETEKEEFEKQFLAKKLKIENELQKEIKELQEMQGKLKIFIPAKAKEFEDLQLKTFENEKAELEELLRL
jgi:hypothetical protein